jgi:hypothetical protein
MRGVTTAPAAVLLELDTIRRVALRLHGLVVAPLALGAGERDLLSDACLCHVFLSAFGEYFEEVAAGGLEPPTRGL